MNGAAAGGGLEDVPDPHPEGRPEVELDWGEPELPNSRHGARCLALQALYWNASSPGDIRHAFEDLSPKSGLDADNCAFAWQVIAAVAEHATVLAQLIEDAAHSWSPERIARLDGLIMRLALAEILYIDDVPPRVSIDEAVELAKAYGGEQSYAFVNGILDAVATSRGLEV